MDPRISARRTAVIREQGRRRLIIGSVVLGAVALLVGGWFLLHTPLFSARSVTVTGNVHETSAQVMAQSGLADHPPLLDVDTGAVAARLEQLPWVRTATVQRGVARRRAHRRDRGDAPVRGQDGAGGVGDAQLGRPRAGRVRRPATRAPGPDRPGTARRPRHHALGQGRRGSASPRRCPRRSRGRSRRSRWSRPAGCSWP